MKKNHARVVEDYQGELQRAKGDIIQLNQQLEHLDKQADVNSQKYIEQALGDHNVSDNNVFSIDDEGSPTRSRRESHFANEAGDKLARMRKRAASLSYDKFRAAHSWKIGITMSYFGSLCFLKIHI